MNDVRELITRMLAQPRALKAEELHQLLIADDAALDERLFAAARELKQRLGKTAVLPRALIETSNRCQKNCYYCGIRRDQTEVHRYQLSIDEILAMVDAALHDGFCAVAFQAGEIESEKNTRFYEELLAALPPRVEVTLSLGEQTETTYQRWQKAAGDRVLRYLLRIETSDPRLYASLHPADHSFCRRRDCLRALKHLGYITGSGVMIGLPGQNLASLANDLVFFGEERLDMIGMGPYIPTPGTPLYREQPAASLALAYRLIALTRLHLHAVNIVAATALEALGGAEARQRGIDAGANVIMPNYTPSTHRDDYQLYPHQHDLGAN